MLFGPYREISGISLIASRILRVVSYILLVLAMYPFLPIILKAAQVPAMIDPGLYAPQFEVEKVVPE